MAEFLEVVITYPDRESAAKTAKLLVERRYAACVQIHGPIESTYRWNGKVESSKEWTLTAKTTKKAYKRLERAVKELHPYSVPQVVALPIIDGLKEYLKWVESEVE
jgi:periplasmic divalent cation tolerance protein